QLYALDLARAGIAHEQGIGVMEGYTDVIMAHQHGITNAVAVLGTALGERHVPLVRRFTDSVTLVLDGDEAGQRRTMQILDELLALFVTQEIDLQILTLPEGADPCDVIATQGSDAFRQLLLTSVDALDHKINAVTNGLASASGTHRSAQAVEEILSALARALPMHMGASSAGFVREQQVLSRLSREFGVTEDALHTRLTARRREIASRSQSQRAAKPASDEPRSTQRLTLTAWERELLELLLHQPEVLPRLAEVLTPEEIPTNVCRAFYVQALAAMHAGQIPTFDQLMLSTDDNDAKNLLVDCDERGRDKLASDTDQRVRDLIDQVHENSLHERQSKQLAVFHKKTLEPKKEDEEIDSFFKELAKKQTKRRQTGSAPTDG
ncbi:MAG: toprim domain-containing protein, partial [Pseudomonadales bacterium]